MFNYPCTFFHLFRTVKSWSILIAYCKQSHTRRTMGEISSNIIESQKIRRLYCIVKAVFQTLIIVWVKNGCQCSKKTTWNDPQKWNGTKRDKRYSNLELYTFQSHSKWMPKNWHLLDFNLLAREWWEKDRKKEIKDMTT